MRFESLPKLTRAAGLGGTDERCDEKKGRTGVCVHSARGGADGGGTVWEETWETRGDQPVGSSVPGVWCSSDINVFRDSF